MSSLTNNKPALFSAGSKIEIKLKDVLQASQTRRDILMNFKSDQISSKSVRVWSI